MSSSSTATLITAIIGAGGAGMFIRELVSGIQKITSGVAGREDTRKNDLIFQRKQATVRADAWEHNAGILYDNFSAARDTIAVLRGKLLERGYPERDLPVPVYGDTLSRAAIDELVAQVVADAKTPPTKGR